MILETVLANYKLWRTDIELTGQPEVVTQLNWGSVHHAVKVAADSQQGTQFFVVRFLSRIEASLALPFEQEVALLQAAADAGLAPKVIYVSAVARVLVTDFVDGSLDSNAIELGQLIRKIHALPPIGNRLKLFERLAFYTDSALSRGVVPNELIDPQHAPLRAAIAHLEALPAVTCHNDLGYGNVLRTPHGPMAIDWEYAATGCAYFDVAAACACWPGLDEGKIVIEALPSDFSPLNWLMAKAVYAAIEWNWYHASGITPPAWCTRERVTDLVNALP